MDDNLVKTIKKYYRVWLITAKISLARVLATRTASLLFFIGKMIRFSLFIYFITIIGRSMGGALGFKSSQLLLYFIVFNFFESLGQVFFRGIYWFRQQVISGEFDFRLTKPISPLFQVLTRDTDILDIPMVLITACLALPEILSHGLSAALPLAISAIASILLTIALHILVAAFGIITTEVDNLLWTYREVSLMARFPIDLYGKVAETMLTYILPVGIMYTFPAQAILGKITNGELFGALVVAICFYVASISYWHYALKQYTSASS